MRIFVNFTEARGEIARDLKEMGVHVNNVRMQDKSGEFPTLELINYGYTVLEPEEIHLDITKDWCEEEWKERRQGIFGDPRNTGYAWKIRTPIWESFLEVGGQPIPAQSLPHVIEEERGCKGDPYRFAYTYSERFSLEDQVMNIIRELRRNPFSRQLYISVWDPDVDSNRLAQQRRVPCSLGYHFMLRRDQLHITYTMRSCDFITHWQNDVWLALKLQCFVAHMTGNKPGQFSQFINSLHVYEKDVKDVF